MSACYKLEDGKPVIYLSCRDRDKNRHIVRVRGFKPYFYVPDENGEYLSIFGDKCKKVFVETPGDVPSARKRYTRTFEADIKFEMRYLIDAQIFDTLKVEEGRIYAADERLDVKPRIGYFDIEVSSPPEVVPQPENPVFPVVALSLLDSYTDKKYVFLLESKTAKKADGAIYGKTEFHLFHLFAEKARECDWLVGWFSNSYDLPYLYERHRRGKLNLSEASCLRTVSAKRLEKKRPLVKLLGHEALDLLEWYRIVTKPEGMKASYDLKFVVSQECGFAYEDWGDRIEILYEKDHDTLYEYMVNELEALKRIDLHRGLMEEVDRRRSVVGVLPSMCHSTKACCHTFLLRIAKERKRVFPTLTAAGTSAYRGALVCKVKPGIYEDVAVYDIKSLYPSIIVGRNLSYETYQRGFFVPEPEGILPAAVRRLMETREALRSQRKKLTPGTKEYELLYTLEQSVKYHVNSFYGVQKYFMPLIAEEVTRTGRQILKKLASLVPDIIYYDTDSLFVLLGSDDWTIGLELEQELKAALKRICGEMGFKVPLDIKYEAFYKRLYVHAPKHYAALCIMKDCKPVEEIVLKGVVLKKSDTCLYAQKVGRKFFELLLKKGPSAALSFYKEKANEFYKMPLHEIAIPRGVHKMTRKNPWVRGVEYSQRHLGLRFREDYRPLLLYVKAVRGHPRTDVVCFPTKSDIYKFEDLLVIDWRKQFEKAFEIKFRKFIDDLKSFAQRRLI